MHQTASSLTPVPPNTRGHKSWRWGIIVDKSAAISCYPISKVLALGLVLLKECISRLTNRSKIITHSIFSVKNGNTTRKLELKSLRIEIYIPVFWPPSPPPVPEKWGMCKFEKCPCQLNWRKHKCLSSVATSLSVTVACYADIFRSSSQQIFVLFSPNCYIDYHFWQGHGNKFLLKQVSIQLLWDSFLVNGTHGD